MPHSSLQGLLQVDLTLLLGLHRRLHRRIDGLLLVMLVRLMMLLLRRRRQPLWWRLLLHLLLDMLCEELVEELVKNILVRGRRQLVEQVFDDAVIQGIPGNSLELHVCGSRGLPSAVLGNHSNALCVERGQEVRVREKW